MEDTDTQVTHRDKESSVGVSVMSISDNSVAMKNLVSLKEKINGTIGRSTLGRFLSRKNGRREKKREDKCYQFLLAHFTFGEITDN